MRTDDLIAALAADTVPQPGVGQRFARSLPAALGVSVAVFAVFWGPRADLSAALGSVVALKTILPFLLLLLAGGLAFALAHPAMRSGVRFGALLTFVAVIGAALLFVIAPNGLSGLTRALATPSLAVCLLSIPALALPILGAVFWSLASGASLRPRLTGAVAGLMAGGASAAIYSLYCDQDAALFALPAYTVAILCVAGIGALAGPRLLRW